MKRLASPLSCLSLCECHNIHCKTSVFVHMSEGDGNVPSLWLLVMMMSLRIALPLIIVLIAPPRCCSAARVRGRRNSTAASHEGVSGRRGRQGLPLPFAPRCAANLLRSKGHPFLYIYRPPSSFVATFSAFHLHPFTCHRIPLHQPPRRRAPSRHCPATRRPLSLPAAPSLHFGCTHAHLHPPTRLYTQGKETLSSASDLPALNLLQAGPQTSFPLLALQGILIPTFTSYPTPQCPTPTPLLPPQDPAAAVPAPLELPTLSLARPSSSIRPTASQRSSVRAPMDVSQLQRTMPQGRVWRSRRSQTSSARGF